MSKVSNIAILAEEVRLKSCRYLLAGNAKFTVVCGDERFTYHFFMPTHGKNKGKMTASLLTGPDNESDFSEIGEIREDGQLILSGIGIKEGKATLTAALAKWLVKLAFVKADVPKELKLYGTGHCLKCGRVLTAIDNPFFPIFGLDCGSRQ